MWVCLVSGMVFGLSAGLAPGPLFTLVLTETLRKGRRAGLMVAFAPLITDLPIVALSLLVISGMAVSHAALGMVSLFGAAFVGYLGYEALVSPGMAALPRKGQVDSLKKGIIANFLNPHPYLFWVTVGAPTAIKAYAQGVFPAGAFILGFYLLLVGSKAVLSLTAGQARSLLTGSLYRYCMKALGVFLFLFSLILIRDAVHFFKAAGL